MARSGRSASYDRSGCGRWRARAMGDAGGASAVVELVRCADAATLCGTIRLLWEPTDDKGQPRLDSQNTDPYLRTRPLLGLSILSGLSPPSGGAWEGRIYNPEDGQTLSCIGQPPRRRFPGCRRLRAVRVPEAGLAEGGRAGRGAPVKLPAPLSSDMCCAWKRLRAAVSAARSASPPPVSPNRLSGATARAAESTAARRFLCSLDSIAAPTS